MPKALELTGQKFGHLTVIKQMPSKKGSTMWLCQCSCGNKTVAVGKELKFGHKKTCGCRHGLSPKDYIMSKIKIDPITGCWIWQASLTRGYGQAKLNGKQFKSHRLSYTFFKSPIPKGKLVCHTCDNKLCCNPDHLWLGTTDDNMHDMVEKDRQPRGERNRHSKLIESEVIKIRQLYKEGKGKHLLAEIYDISVSSIEYIVRFKTWKHVK